MYRIKASVTVNVLVTDDSPSAPRVVVLYRSLSSRTWQKVELAYNATTNWATGRINERADEYMVQAVDATGNVAWRLDHGNPFSVEMQTAWHYIYLPLVLLGSR